MYYGKKILALIPARAGSKGIKNKNIIPIAEKPLIAYTIEAALKSEYIDKTVVSTDGLEIASIATQYGADVPFLRPKQLAGDKSKTIDAVLHAIGALRSIGEDYAVLVLLQPTQPLRTAEDIDSAVKLYFKMEEKPLVSISPVRDHPLLIRKVGNNGEAKPIIEKNSTCRRQDMDIYYRVNGCIYINNISELNEDTSFNDNEIPFIMPKSHSIDIDEELDLYIARYFLHHSDKEIE